MKNISYDFEGWEALSELHDEEDYPTLVKYCKEKLKKNPKDPYSQIYLGEAYVLNGDYEKAIQFLTRCLKNDPENIDFQYVILDALFALGKDETDYEWVEKPNILRMCKEIVDFCYEFLRPKRKPRTICDLFIEFIPKGYLLFNERDLLEALLRDERFIVSNTDVEDFAKVIAVRRK
jgi:tetratricopeptide (TPR) repeat protein